MTTTRSTSTTAVPMGIQLNHAEGVVTDAPAPAPAKPVASCEPGSGAGGVWLNHAEGVVR